MPFVLNVLIENADSSQHGAKSDVDITAEAMTPSLMTTSSSELLAFMPDDALALDLQQIIAPCQ